FGAQIRVAEVGRLVRFALAIGDGKLHVWSAGRRVSDGRVLNRQAYQHQMDRVGGHTTSSPATSSPTTTSAFWIAPTISIGIARARVPSTPDRLPFIPADRLPAFEQRTLGD